MNFSPGLGNNPAEAPHALDISSDGRITVAGTSYDGTRLQATLARLTPAGALDRAFNQTGIAYFAPNGNAAGLADLTMQPDGRLLAAGTSATGLGRFLMMRLWP